MIPDTHSSFVRHNMDGALKVLLLAALILLVSAQAPNYESLSNGIRKHVDKALNNVRNTYGEGHHVAYQKIIGTPRILDIIFNVNVLLSVKKCENNPHNTDECVPQNKILYLMDCLLCKTTDNEELLDCAKKIDVINNLREDTRNKCRKNLPGSNSLARTSEAGDSEKTGGCPGCM